MKRHIFTILALLSISYGGDCSIYNYNSGATCGGVEASLGMAIMEAEQYFQQQRREKINNPTQDLADDLNGYDKVTGYIMTYSNSILELRKKILFYQKKLSFQTEKRKKLASISGTAKTLSTNIDVLEAEINQALIKKSEDEQ